MKPQPLHTLAQTAFVSCTFPPIAIPAEDLTLAQSEETRLKGQRDRKEEISQAMAEAYLTVDGERIEGLKIGMLVQLEAIGFSFTADRGEQSQCIKSVTAYMDNVPKSVLQNLSEAQGAYCFQPCDVNASNYARAQNAFGGCIVTALAERGVQFADADKAHEIGSKLATLWVDAIGALFDQRQLPERYMRYVRA